MMISPADALLLKTTLLSEGIIRPELPDSYHFNPKYCDTDAITLEVSQNVKYLNQTVLLCLRKYISHAAHANNIPQVVQSYYDTLLKLEYEKTSDILSQEF